MKDGNHYSCINKFKKSLLLITACIILENIIAYHFDTQCASSTVTATIRPPISVLCSSLVQLLHMIASGAPNKNLHVIRSSSVAKSAFSISLVR